MQYVGSNNPQPVGGGTATGDVRSSSPNSPRVLVSSSLNGPWVENGRTCVGQQTFYKIVGADLSRALKGCMDLSSNKGCHDLTKHRSFTTSEIVNGEIITSLTAVETASFPKAQYSFFTSDSPDVNTIVLRKVGSTEFQVCSGSGGTAPPSGPVCNWVVTNPKFVIGPSPVAYPPDTVCSTSIAGQLRNGYYKDPLRESEYIHRCECK